MTSVVSANRRVPSKRSRSETPFENPPRIVCDGCRDDISELSFAKIVDCDHRLCFQCFGAAHAARSVEYKMTCPCCSKKSTSWEIHTYSAGSTRSAQPQHQPPMSQTIEPPLDDKFMATHPNLYHQHQTPEYRRSYAILTLAVPSVKGNTRVWCAQLRTDGKNEEESTETLAKLYQIGRSLSPCLLSPPEKGAKSKDTLACMTSIEQLEKEDHSPLRRFLHGLTGAELELVDGSKNRTKYIQREHNMSFIATDLIRTCKGGGVNHASKVKDLISDNLTVAGVQDFIKDLFAECGLAKSRKYINLAQDRVVDKRIEQGWDASGRGYGLVVGAYDNLGFKKVKSYVQFTMMAILFFSVYDLIKLKIYPDPKKTDNIVEAKRECLSWVKEDWEELKESYTFKIDEKDAEILATQVTIPMIRFVLDAYKDVLPSYEQSQQVMNGQDITFTSRVSRSVSGRRSMPHTPQTSEVEMGGETTTNLCETAVDEEEVGSIDNLDNEYAPNKNTIYSRNNATIDSPIKEDLNAQKTVMGIVNYFCTIKDRCLKFTTRSNGVGDAIEAVDEEGEMSDELDINGNPWAEEGWKPEDWPEPWMQTRGVYLCGDGQPTFAMLRLQKTHDDFEDKVFMPFNGGFHTMLEIHKLRGKIFGPAHMREVWGHWRTSKAQLDWVMSPGDPNQVEDELVMYYLGAVAAAIKELIDHREACNEDAAISAFDVFTFMQDAAQRSPIAQSIYNELRFAEVIFLLQLAEEKGNAEFFATGLKFASLLYTVNHATKYTEIATDFLVWWRCASEADKAIFQKFILTRQTPANKHIFTDRFFEWLIRDLRGGAGKHYRRGTDAALERKSALVTLEKEFQSAFKQQNKSKGEEASSSSQRRVGNAFCYTLAYFVQEKIWKATDSDGDTLRRSITTSSAQISVDMIDLPFIGESRMNDYIYITKVEDEQVQEDREKSITACLKDVHPTSEKQDDNDKRDLQRCISTTEAFVIDAYNKNELVDVYKNQVKACWPDDKVPKVGGKKNKADYAKTICDARKVFIESDPRWESKTKQKLQQEMNNRNEGQVSSIRGRMSRIKRHLFFNLIPSTHTLRSEAAYTEKINVSAASVAQTASLEEEDLSFIQNLS